jgi:hypothetical protein
LPSGIFPKSPELIFAAKKGLFPRFFNLGRDQTKILPILDENRSQNKETAHKPRWAAFYGKKTIEKKVGLVSWKSGKMKNSSEKIT